VVALAGWCLFAEYLLAQALGGPALVWNDTAVYAHIASAPIWSRQFWAGQRPPVTALLIKLVGSADGFLITQAVVAGVCWGFLAFTVGRLVEPGWRRVAAIWAILAVATAFPITLWNRSVLSESLSMSLSALLFATLIWTASRWTWPRVGSVVAVCLCFAGTRDAQIWTVGFLAVAIGVWAGAAFVQRHREVALRAGALSACLFALVALTGWGAVSSHRTQENVADVFYVRVFPFPGRVAWFAAHGMPQSGRVDRMAQTIDVEPGTAKVVYVSPSDPAFEQLNHWLVSKGSSTYFLWLLAHPGYVITEPLARPERAFNFAKGDLLFYAAQTNRMDSPLTTLVWPPLVGLLVVAGVAAVVSVTSRGWRQPVWRMVVVLTAIGLLSMLVAWHGDGQEVTRHTIEGFAQLRIGLWIVIVLGLLGSSRSTRFAPKGDVKGIV
jgi:hypothetical protein